jgi:hypothetical protein
MNRPRSFDEQGALERVQRFQEQIAEARRRRQRATEQFEAFVREGGRRAAASPASSAPAAARSRQEPVAALPPVEPEPPRPTADLPQAAGPTAAAHGEGAAERLAAGRMSGRYRSPEGARGRRWVIAAGAVVLLILAVTAYRWWSPQSRGAQQPQATPAARESAAPQPPDPDAAAATPAPAVPAPPGVELIAERQVWVRVTVDGRVRVERELPPGQRLPFDFQRAITIRAGDAGAVRLMVGGRDEGVMGPAGQVRNRTIVVPASEQ